MDKTIPKSEPNPKVEKKNKKETPSELSLLKSDNAALKDKLARSLADYANLEKRVESQRQLYATLAAASVVDKVITVLDDLYLVQAYLKDQGLQMSIDKFVNLLKTEGVEEIAAQDQEFDPARMDCVDVAIGKQNVVVEVRKRGYTLNDQVLRPAQVVVGKDEKVKNS